MENKFINLLNKAYELKWCTRLYCTTCGSRVYRTELRKMAGELGGGLTKTLANIEPKEIVKLHNWEDALIIAFYELQFREQKEEVIRNWLPKIRDSFRFTDWVLFKMVRSLPKMSRARIDWIDECIEIAQKHKHFSIAETLCMVLRKDIVNYSKLLELTKEIVKFSWQMNRVLRNVCEIDLE